MSSSTPDAVDAIQARWLELRPGLDVEVIGIIGRILRSATVINRHSDELLAGLGLGRGEFDVLSALRRTGGPLSPGALRDATSASGAAVTKRLKALATRGLVVRHPDPADGRAALIDLTEAGRDVIDRALPAQLDLERSLIADLPASRRPAVEAALRDVLAMLE
ncbi:MarR family transcriptional regulator [Nakamurella sp. YIM 132087]|uniref:MarR family transcriptional regulator n=1 Tax=Nakamurella alba TaxID=2665158 RepID=A0A7K1FPK7_9ACTN|nr:MarR family transcriptional regulator [Nakamurella alba]MTD16071.1 MarR family transcriptional regulator [Nakamurella alba]